MLLSLIALASIPLGYWISSLVPAELPVGERWFLIATVAFCLPLFYFLVWWKAAIIAGLVLLGWFPALLGLGWGASTEGVAFTQLLCVLGMLIGSRWRTEKKPLKHLLVGVIVAAALALLPQFI